MNKANQIQKPEPLDPAKYHTRSEIRAYQDAMADYVNAVRGEEARQRQKAESEARQLEPRYIGDDEYDQIKRAEWEAEQARRKQQAESEAAKEHARIEYLSSSPDVAVITENNAFSFVQTVIHWAAKGYTLPDDGLKFFSLGSFCAEMAKPVTTGTRKAK